MEGNSLKEGPDRRERGSRALCKALWTCMSDLDGQSWLAPMLTMCVCCCRQLTSAMNDAGPSKATCKHHSMCRQSLQAVLVGPHQ